MTVIIPVHNEERRLERTLLDFAAALPTEEILVALNGCTDGSLALVQRMAAEHHNVQFFEVPQRIGKGGALRAGALLCDTPYVAFVDADGSTSALEFMRLFDILREAQVPGLIGSRWLDARTVNRPQPILRRVVSRGCNFLVRLLFGINFKDTQCGVKLFRREDLMEVLPDVETASFAFDVDLLCQLGRKKKQVLEVPTYWVDMPGSKVDLLRASLRAFASIVRLRLNLSLLSIVVPIFDALFPTKPMRHREKLEILILNARDVTHPRAGAPDRYLHEVAKVWTRGGHGVTWLTASYQGATKYETVEGVRVIRVGNGFTVYVRAIVEYLCSLRGRFDVIVDSENGIPFFSPLFSLRPKILLMHQVHREKRPSEAGWLRSWLLAVLEARIMPFIYRHSALVPVSDDVRQEMLAAGITRYETPVARSGGLPATRDATKAANPTVCYVGSLEPHDSVDLLVAAMPRIIEKVPAAKLVVAGTGSEDSRLRGLVADLSLEAAVTFHRAHSEAEKRRIYQAAWVCCIPSTSEPSSIAATEANACGTPVVAFDVGGIRVPAADITRERLLAGGVELAEGILALLENDAQRAHQTVGVADASEHTWEETASMIMTVIEFATCRFAYGLFRTPTGLRLVGEERRLRA